MSEVKRHKAETPLITASATPSPNAIEAILERVGRQHSRLIPVLQAVQEHEGYLSEPALRRIATGLGLPAAHVYGVATFYTHFALEARGKYVIRLCDGTACHVKASIPILEALRARLGLDEGKRTSTDGLFTVETVACLGACGLAPVVVVNEEVHGQVTPASAVALVEEIIAREAKEAATGSAP